MRKYLFIVVMVFINNAKAANCPVAPAGISDIEGKGYYIDSHHSIIDPDLQEQSKKALKPFNDFLKTVSKNSDSYIASGDKNFALCALNWLNKWAQDDVMLGKMISHQGQYERQWILAGAAIAYIKVKSEADLEERKNIESWFSELANAVLEFVKNNHEARNNHYYWVGLASMATGVATNNDYYIDEARKIYDSALLDIQNDGSLPLELKRAGRALHYHNFAIAPLVLMAELAKSKNENWHEHQNHRLDKLAKLTLEGITDNNWFEKKTGVKQEILKNETIGWSIFYLNYKPEFANLIKPILEREPFIDMKLGGNLSLLSQKHFFDHLWRCHNRIRKI